MKPTKKSPPKKRNLAAKALRAPLFRPKVMEDPAVYKRRVKFAQKPDDEPPDDQIN
ncbi:MAG: hypothetical protein ABI398_05820 [Devosia sp.]